MSADPNRFDYCPACTHAEESCSICTRCGTDYVQDEPEDTRMVNNLDLVNEIENLKAKINEITNDYHKGSLSTELYIGKFQQLTTSREYMINLLCSHIKNRKH